MQYSILICQYYTIAVQTLKFTTLEISLKINITLMLNIYHLTMLKFICCINVVQMLEIQHCKLVKKKDMSY